MEEQAQNNPHVEDKKDCCTHSGYCYCGSIAAIAIIALVWLMPSWANIAITVLAVLIIIGSGNCFCKSKK